MPIAVWRWMAGGGSSCIALLGFAGWIREAETGYQISIFAKRPAASMINVRTKKAVRSAFLLNFTRPKVLIRFRMEEGLGVMCCFIPLYLSHE